MFPFPFYRPMLISMLHHGLLMLCYFWGNLHLLTSALKLCFVGYKLTKHEMLIVHFYAVNLISAGVKMFKESCMHWTLDVWRAVMIIHCWMLITCSPWANLRIWSYVCVAYELTYPEMPIVHLNAVNLIFYRYMRRMRILKSFRKSFLFEKLC